MSEGTGKKTSSSGAPAPRPAAKTPGWQFLAAGALDVALLVALIYVLMLPGAAPEAAENVPSPPPAAPAITPAPAPQPAAGTDKTMDAVAPGEIAGTPTEAATPEPAHTEEPAPAEEPAVEEEPAPAEEPVAAEEPPAEEPPVEEPPAEPADEPAEAPAAVEGEPGDGGTVSVYCRPWSDIYVDGVLVKSDVRLNKHPVTPGKHVIKLVCSVEENREQSFTVDAVGDDVNLGCWDFKTMTTCAQ